MNVKLKLKVLNDAIVVPSVAVQEGANGSYVYLVTPENTVKITPVSVVQEGERQAVIGSGVTPGDLVVTAGFASLQDGTKVKVEVAGEAFRGHGWAANESRHSRGWQQRSSSASPPP